MKTIFDICPRAQSVTSRANATVVRLAKLAQPKYRREEKLFLAEGVKLSREAAGLPEIRYILVSAEDGAISDEAADILAKAPETAAVLALSPEAFAKISTEQAPQGIITVLSCIDRLHATVKDVRDYAQSVRGARLLAVDEVRDPGNLGTIFRTAAAFGFDRVLLGSCADIYNPKTVRAAMGALFRLQTDTADDLPAALTALRASGRRVLAAALTENCLELGRDPICLSDCVVIGNEGHGVSAQVLAAADNALKIPMEAGTESLNAAGAATVLMWEYYRLARNLRK